MADLFTEDQLEEFKNSFALFEKDENHISVKDLGNVTRSLGLCPTEAELTHYTSTLDTEATGTVEYNDFLHILAKAIKDTDPETELTEAFKVFDKQNTGIITGAKLRQLMTTHGEVLNDEEVDEMIKEADTDADGIVDYAEFVSMILAP